MEEYKIGIITMATTLNGAEIDDLTDICNENNISFVQVKKEQAFKTLF